MIYDFRNGDTAFYLLNKLRAQLVGHSNFIYQHVKNIRHEDITFTGNSFIHRTGEHEHYMFAYKKRFSTIKYKTLPRYHVTQCETRETYTGYRFANQMPVNIYCIDQRKDLGPQKLELCKNCHQELSFFSYGDEGTAWFDVILNLAENREYTIDDMRSDGYTKDWEQVSLALRFKRGFICESCGINLSERNARWFCEVHHIDGKTNNSQTNLKCLCIRCHANVDEWHRENYSRGNNRKKLDQFDIYFSDPNYGQFSFES